MYDKAALYIHFLAAIVIRSLADDDPPEAE